LKVPEETKAAVVVASRCKSFELDEEQIAALRESIDEADRGELVSLDAVPSGR
jgi:hypothetical protein